MTHEAVQTAKARHTTDGIVTLSTGARVNLRPVAPGLLADATGRVKFPKPPLWRNPEKEREEPNYNDPDYLEAVSEASRRQGQVTLDVLVMFGVELLDGVPEDGKWLKQLKMLERMGAVDLSEYDLTDPLEQEFVYKRHVAMGSDDFELVKRVSGLTREEVDAAADSFPGTA